jgi:arginase family enzyme
LIKQHFDLSKSVTQQTQAAHAAVINDVRTFLKLLVTNKFRFICIGNTTISASEGLQGQLGFKRLHYHSAENRKAEVAMT